MYGHRWVSSFGDEIDPGNIWATVLRGLTKDDVSRGFNKIVELRLEWPPSAPEFLKMCDSNDYLSQASALNAFIKVVSNGVHNTDWSKVHPAIYWCYQEIGSWDCRSLAAVKLESRFKDLWPEAMQKYTNGDLQAKESEMIEKSDIESEPVTQERLDEELSKLKKMFKD